MVYLLDISNLQPWDSRWLSLFLLPLILGGVAGFFAWVNNEEGERSKKLSDQNKEANENIAGRLAFLFALLTGIGGLNANQYLTAGKVDVDDFVVLFAANIVFAALAASHGVVSDFPKGKIARLARFLVLTGAVASLSSILVLIWRVQETQVLPLWVRVIFSIMLCAAAVAITFYVRRSMPKRAEAATVQPKYVGAPAHGQAKQKADRAADFAKDKTL